MFPRGVLIYLTDACTLNCTHCGIVKEKNAKYMEYRCFEKLLNLLQRKKCYIVAISGGEPLLHPKLFEIASEIRKNKMLVVLGIAGVGLEENQIHNIVKSGISCVQISLDGSNERTNSIFRGQGVFNEIIKNIKLLQKKEIRVNLATCICKENLRDFNAILDLFLSLNAYEVKVQFWQKTSENNIFSELSNEEREHILEQILDFEDKYDKHGWISIDTTFNSAKYNYLKENQNIEEKFIVYPNGDVKSSETGGNYIGNILLNIKEVEKYYE